MHIFSQSDWKGEKFKELSFSSEFCILIWLSYENIVDKTKKFAEKFEEKLKLNKVYILCLIRFCPKKINSYNISKKKWKTAHFLPKSTKAKVHPVCQNPAVVMISTASKSLGRRNWNIEISTKPIPLFVLLK